jgi:hypothetical protein
MKADMKIGYTVLRYVHDQTTQEFVNIGVLAFSPESGKCSFRCSDRVKRLHGLFPGAAPQRFQKLVSCVQTSFDNCHQDFRIRRREQLLPTDVMAIAASVIPQDSSALQWSSPSGGYFDNLNSALDHAFVRYVSRYDRVTTRSRGTSTVIKPFRESLRRAGVWKYIEPETFKGRLEIHEFKYVWKNGAYNCYEPINFDVQNYRAMQAKAAEWLGRAVDIEETGQKEYRLHLMLAKPTRETLFNAYDDTVEGMIELLPPATTVVRQEGIEQFAEKVANKITSHLKDDH